MRLLVTAAIFAIGCRSSGSAITCELAGDHVHAIMNAQHLRTQVADLCKERDWSTAARGCVASVPSIGELGLCAGDLGDSAAPLDKLVTAERQRLSDESIETQQRRGLRLDLPTGRSMEIDPAIQSLVLEVAPGADVVVGGKAMPDGQLDNLFRVAYTKDHGVQVIIKAGRDVPHARVVELMERAKHAGITRLAIGTRAE